jgi:hypothetical protein
LGHIGNRYGVFEGRDAIRRFCAEWNAVYEEYEVVLDEFHDLGNGVIFSVFFQRGRLKGSSAFVEVRIANVGIWSDQLIQRITQYIELDEGRAAAERLARKRG